MEKRLTRSKTNKVFAGVMGGLGEFFAVDPVLIRLGYLILTVFTGFVPGIIGYLLAILIVPETPPAPSMPEAAGKGSDDTETV